MISSNLEGLGRMARLTVCGAVFTLATAGAAPGASAQGEVGATAEIRDASGATVGVANFAQTDAGVWIHVEAWNLPPGEHGMHLHEVGACDGPDFMTSMGHLNPLQHEHGFANPSGPHVGDMPALMVQPDGTAYFEAIDPMISIDSGGTATPILGQAGTALVIHADADDQMTDPSGNSGARIACGVVAHA